MTKKANVTIKDVAKHAGVKPSAALLVINEAKNVPPRMRDKILRVAAKIGYETDVVMRSLKSRASPSVALSFPEHPKFFTTTYFMMLIKGIQNACKKYNRSLTLISLDQTKGESYYQVSKKWLVNLMVIINVDYTRDISKDVQDLKNGNIYFSIITKYPGKEKVNTVCVDNYEGVKLALEHFVSLGHRRIGFVSGNANSADGPERLEAFKVLSKKLNLDREEGLIAYGEFDIESAEREVHKLLNLEKKPTAIFAASDYMAIGAMRAIKLKGLSIPKDIALVGFDDTLEAIFISPALTTVRQPLLEMGEAAVDLAVRSMNNPRLEPQASVLKPSLVVRESCGARST